MMSERDKWIVAKFSSGEYEATKKGILLSHNPYKTAKRGPLAVMQNPKTGYMQITMWDKDERKGVLCLVHRVVALIHIPNPLGLPEVNHEDGDKTNNAATNLEWSTCSGNLKHAYIAGLRSAAGEKNGQAKLTAEIVRRIKLRRGEAAPALAREFGISRQAINDIQAERTWRAV